MKIEVKIEFLAVGTKINNSFLYDDNAEHYENIKYFLNQHNS